MLLTTFKERENIFSAQFACEIRVESIASNMNHLWSYVFAVSCCSLVVGEFVEINVSECGFDSKFMSSLCLHSLLSLKPFSDPECIVHNVTVDHCLIDRSTKACRLRRDETYRLNMDFTPDFDGDKFTLLAYALIPGADAEFAGMDSDACHWMTCPVEKGVMQTYSFELKMKKSYPKGLFNVRWLMKKNGEPKCCFVNKFKIE